jgi:2-polyprenyl-6-methoxyphenol hydroxylase-like FAD-dependent oxidoreductase
MSTTQPRIAIVGGGPAGLTLGCLLYNNGIPFTIFELREKPTDIELAKPSGMLDLHTDTGVAAIRECGLYDEFVKLTGECSEAQVVANIEGTIVYQDDGSHESRPEISRHALTKLLLTHIPAELIKWGHKLVSAVSKNNSQHTEVELDFGSHGKETFDLVIGADGAWSKIRRSLLTDIKPHYLGKQNITMVIRNITTKYPHLAELVGTGSFVALGSNHMVASQRGPQDSSRIYLFLSIEDDENFATTIGFADKPAVSAKEKLLNDPKLIGKFGSIIKELVTAACNEETADNPDGVIDIRPMYSLPAGHSWEHKTGTTLIGDASHLMGPWAGEGVNSAMCDAMLLSQAIIKTHETTAKDNLTFQATVDPLVRDFEIDMAARSKEFTLEAIVNMNMLHGDNAAHDFVKFFNDAIGHRVTALGAEEEST